MARLVAARMPARKHEKQKYEGAPDSPLHVFGISPLA
jgi:hypothetical protein